MRNLFAGLMLALLAVSAGGQIIQAGNQQWSGNLNFGAGSPPVSGGGGGGGGTPTQVQNKTYASSANATTHTITFTSTPTSGNLLVITVSADDYVATAPSGWTKAVSAEDFTGNYILYKVAGASEPTGVTVTIGSSTHCAMCAFEYSGVNTLDKTASATFQGSGPNVINTGTTATTTAANEVLIACASSNQTARSVTAWDNSFTQFARVLCTGTGTKVWNTTATRIVSATGAYTTTATLDAASGGHDSGTIATFK